MNPIIAFTGFLVFFMVVFFAMCNEFIHDINRYWSTKEYAKMRTCIIAATMVGLAFCVPISAVAVLILRQ